MKKAFLGIFLVFSLSGCALFSAAVNPIFGDGASSASLEWAEKVFVTFNTGWIGALKHYREELPQCGAGVKAPCWEPEIYKKLHAVTDAATACQVAATAPGVDIISLQDCVNRVTDAKLEFTQNGVVPKGVPL